MSFTWRTPGGIGNEARRRKSRYKPFQLPRKPRCWLSHEEYLERGRLKPLLTAWPHFLSLSRKSPSLTVLRPPHFWAVLTLSSWQHLEEDRTTSGLFWHWSSYGSLSNVANGSQFLFHNTGWDKGMCYQTVALRLWGLWELLCEAPGGNSSMRRSPKGRWCWAIL